jgi:uncharacterized protein with PIN domain
VANESKRNLNRGIMFCTICKKDVEDCTCKDIEERLSSLKNSPHVVFRMCKRCEQHYSRCRCEEPEWISSNEEVPLPDLTEESG